MRQVLLKYGKICRTLIYNQIPVYFGLYAIWKGVKEYKILNQREKAIASKGSVEMFL